MKNKITKARKIKDLKDLMKALSGSSRSSKSAKEIAEDEAAYRKYLYKEAEKEFQTRETHSRYYQLIDSSERNRRREIMEYIYKHFPPGFRNDLAGFVMHHNKRRMLFMISEDLEVFINENVAAYRAYLAEEAES